MDCRETIAGKYVKIVRLLKIHLKHEKFFLVYSSQVFFYLMSQYRFDLFRRIPRRSATSYPTLVIRKSSERRFYLAQLGSGCGRGVMYSVTGGRLSASMEENDDLPACMVTLRQLFLPASFGRLGIVPHSLCYPERWHG